MPEHVYAHGHDRLSEPAERAGLGAAFRHRATEPDAVVIVPHVELLARPPG